MAVPAAVVENIRNKETVVFLGAGFSMAAGFPSSVSVAAMLAAKLREDRKAVDDPTASQLDRVSEVFELTYGRPRLLTEVERFLKGAPDDDISPSHRLLASLIKHGFVRTVVTTNYDSLVEQACERLGVTINVVVDGSQLSAAAGDGAVMYKIHGDFSHPELVALTPADLQGWNYREELRPMVTQLQALFEKSAVLFLGYSLSDFNILALLLGHGMSKKAAPRHKRFASVHPKKDQESAAARLSQYGVDTFDGSDVEASLREILFRLPIKLSVVHLVFNYPGYYSDQSARYGGIETFIDYLRTTGGFDYSEVSVYSTQMLSFNPDYLGQTSYPAYPGSFFYFRAAARSGVSDIAAGGRIRRQPVRGGNVKTLQYADPKTADVVHVHFLPFASMTERSGIPTLCTSHSLLSVDLGFSKGLFDGHVKDHNTHEVRATYEAEREAAASVRFVTVVSSSHEQEVKRLGARSVQRLDAPFDPRRFKVEGDSRRAKERAGLKDRFTITYVGRPDRRKGIEVLVGACEKILPDIADFQLLLVGYGLTREPGVLGVSSKYYMVGLSGGRYLIDVAALERRDVGIVLRQSRDSFDAGVFYSASDIVVVPSLYEPMGYVVLEAMSCGRPVVASRTGGIAEVIRDGHNGLLFEPGDADELAAKLRDLHRDPERARQLGLQAREDMERRKPVAQIVKDWEDLYRQAAFAFGGSLYPSPDLMALIRQKCDSASPPPQTLSAYDVAMIGNRIAEQVMAVESEADKLPEGIPVDSALLRAIATELRRSLQRRGLATDFSITTLQDIMTDLSLAALNRERENPRIFLTAEDTRQKLKTDWFRRLVSGCSQ